MVHLHFCTKFKKIYILDVANNNWAYWICLRPCIHGKNGSFVLHYTGEPQVWWLYKKRCRVSKCIPAVQIKHHTVSHRAISLSLIRLKPVVRTLPSFMKIALMGRAPSCAFSFSWKKSSYFKQNVVFSKKLRKLAPTTLSFFSYSNNFLLAGVNNTDRLVLAGSADETAIAIPANAVNHVGMHVIQSDHGLACAHVPDDDHVVTTWHSK